MSLLCSEVLTSLRNLYSRLFILLRRAYVLDLNPLWDHLLFGLDGRGDPSRIPAFPMVCTITVTVRSHASSMSGVRQCTPSRVANNQSELGWELVARFLRNLCF